MPTIILPSHFRMKIEGDHQEGSGELSLVKENRRLSEALSEKYRFSNMIGKSKPMLAIYDLIRKVAHSKASF